MSIIENDPKHGRYNLQRAVLRISHSHPMPANPIPEHLVTLLHSISEDRRLAAWLLDLAQHPPAARQAALLGMAGKMRAGGEDAAVAEAIEALAQPHIFDAACQTLRDLGR